MKKTTLLQWIFLIVPLLFITGCSKKTNQQDNNRLLAQIKVKDIVFDMACYEITGTSENPAVQEFYYPRSLHTLVNRHCIDGGKIFYIIETIFPDMKGTIDSTGFYDAAVDTGNWVDQLLIHLEEERIAEELNQMEENLEMGEYLPDQNYEEEIEKVFSNEIQAKELTDKNEVLKFMEFDREIFIPQKTADGYLIIHSSGDRTSRNFYNENYQIEIKENWKISGANNAQLLQTETFIYDEENSRVAKKIVTTKDDETEFIYNEENLVAESSKYNIYKDNKYLISKSSIKYTEDKKVKEDLTTVYTFNADYTKRTDSFSKKYVYFYNEDEEIPPDFEYYEENILKMKNKYSTEKGFYTSQIFFDGDFSVKTYYEDNLKVKDVYTKGNEVIRTKNYEN